MTIRNARLLMLGFGITGRAVCEYAVSHGVPISVSESGALPPEKASWLKKHGIHFEQSGHSAAMLQHADTVVLSPGVSMNHPLLAIAHAQGLSVVSEIEFALRFTRSCSVIAVTGTNGKSSTVEVIGKILQTQGCQAWIGGNIGTPLIGLVDHVAVGDTLVLEMSSYQLEQSPRFHPDIGVLLTLTPDHLHRHKTMQAYANAKANVFANQHSRDVAILPRALAAQFEMGKARRVFYDEQFLTLPEETAGLMPHERSNLRAALAACQALIPGLEISKIPFSEVVPTFRLPHRMQFLGSIRGVSVINDSKSTNAGSTMAALQSIQSPVVLLMGGRSKGAGYEVLIDACERRSLREVVLFGEAAEELKRLFAQRSAASYSVTVVPSMEAAADRGLKSAQSGDVVLLSPACSSFDAFTDYMARGDAFADYVRAKPGFTSHSTRP